MPAGASPASSCTEGNPVWEDTVGELVWGHLLDGIHHRGQLSTYLRPMGSKVPSIYGPSADDSGAVARPAARRGEGCCTMAT